MVKLTIATHLDIAIARFRTRGFDTHHQHHIFLSYQIQAIDDVALKGILAGDILITGHYHDAGVLVALLDIQHSPGHTTCRITIDWFYHQTSVLQLWQLFVHPMLVFLTRAYIYILFWHDGSHATEGVLQLRATCSEEI